MLFHKDLPRSRAILRLMSFSGLFRFRVPPNVPIPGPGNRGENGFCQEYAGASCAGILGGRKIYVTNEKQQGTVDRSLTGMYESIVN